MIPIIKGHIYKTSGASAVNTAIFYFYKFVLKETTPESAVDYIVEQGTSGNWTYRKWNSGIAEFWGYVVIPSVPSAWSSSGYTFNYPITLTQTSSWYVQQLNYQIEVTYLSGVGTNSAAIETKATSAVTNAQIRISFKGRWK